MKDYLRINDLETQHLAWIHSNKFTVPGLFQKKFFFQNTYRNACYVLNKYAQKGFLHMEKPNMFMNNFYYLTVEAIRTLDGIGAMMTRTTKHPIRINHYERTHDLMVQELRIVIESSPELQDVFWLSDFEMRSGITPPMKHRFVDGTLEEEWKRWSWDHAKQLVRRTPDGYFEADIEGKRYEFVLEFERATYNQMKIMDMVWHLTDDFPDTYRLIVSETEKNARRMVRHLQGRLKKDQWREWYISDFKRVTTRPFRKAWHNLARPLAVPAVSPTP